MIARWFGFGVCLLMLFVNACCGHTAVASKTKIDEEPPLSQVRVESPDLPTPVASFQSLSGPEREIVAAILRERASKTTRKSVQVRVLPTMFEVCSEADDVKALSERLGPILSRKEDLHVHSGCRGLKIFSAAGLTGAVLKPDLVDVHGIDIGRTWAALLNGFPDACSVQIDPSTRSDGSGSGSARWTFAAHERQLPSSQSFQGIVIKELTRVTLAPLSVSTPAKQSDSISVTVESAIFWRPRSDNLWTKVSTLADLDPAWVGAGASSLPEACARNLFQVVAR